MYLLEIQFHGIRNSAFFFPYGYDPRFLDYEENLIELS